MSPFLWLFDLLVNLAIVVIIVQAVVSWLIAFDVISMRHRLVFTIWDVAHRLTNPIYKRLRRFVPNLGDIDITPMVVLVALLFLQRLVHAYLV